jgi:tetratricopeptide (TPR) repeat protein
MADARKGEHHANRAREMLRQGRLVDAERELRAAVASDPTRGDWMLNLGWTLEAIGKLDEALQLYRQSCSLLPTARDPRLAEGLVLAKLARHEEAATAFESTLKVDPKCETAVSMLIRSLALAGRHEEAETAYYLALHSIERPATSHLEIARSLLARGDLKRAEHCYRRAVAEGPSLAGARIELARVLALAGRLDDTAPLLAEEFRRGGVPSPLALEGVRIHLAAGRTAEAGQILDQLARTEPSNPRLHLLLARAMRRRGDLVRAARHVEIGAKLSSDVPGLAYEAALLGLLRGERTTARDVLAKEFAARPLDRPGINVDRIDALELVRAFLDTGLVDEASRTFRARFGTEVRRDHGHDVEVLRVGARLSLIAGDFREGRARTRRLLRLVPDSIDALHNLALLALRRGELDVAHGWLARARTTHPADPGLRKLRALYWWKRALKLLGR